MPLALGNLPRWSFKPDHTIRDFLCICGIGSQTGTAGAQAAAKRISPGVKTMAKFNYDAPAVLWPTQTAGSNNRRGNFRRFDTAADAIRHVVEEIPATMAGGTILETENLRLRSEEIRGLYDAL